MSGGFEFPQALRITNRSSRATAAAFKTRIGFMALAFLKLWLREFYAAVTAGFALLRPYSRDRAVAKPAIPIFYIHLRNEEGASLDDDFAALWAVSVVA